MNYRCSNCGHVFGYNELDYKTIPSGAASWSPPPLKPKYCPECGGKLS